jgi:two-component system sensor histidine kinase CiaH
MEKLYKQFAELVIKWKVKVKNDEFLKARIKLTFFYSLTATIILAGASFLLYKVLLVNLYESLKVDLVNPIIAHRILDRAQDILQVRFIVIDILILAVIVFFGFLLTHKTLGPIKMNTQKQKRFIADASHELRTPVAVVISGLEVALRKKDLDINTAREVLEKSLVEMREFSNLSNHLLDISKYDNNKDALNQKIIVLELLKDILSKIEPLALSKKIKIEVKLENKVLVQGNSFELKRVFYNIIHNAITHTKAEGTITVFDDVVRNNYMIYIKDTGIGISKDMLEKVFDPFFQGDVSRSTTGAGLGLTLAKKIVENHKGTIKIESEIGKGTKVIVSLPIIK